MELGTNLCFDQKTGGWDEHLAISHRLSVSREHLDSSVFMKRLLKQAFLCTTSPPYVIVNKVINIDRYDDIVNTKK